MKGNWIRHPKGEACTIFVHGILAEEATCWRHDNGTYWPELLADEPALQEMGVYAFFYRTSWDSGNYSISDIVDALHESLRLDGVLESRRLEFVCHSMGGIVVRRFLVKRAVELISLGKQIGLFLIASPSLGSDYANWLGPIVKFFGHRQAEALRFVRSNEWLSDLDKDFKNLKEAGILPIRGRELIEDKFIVLSSFWRKQVVEPFAGARYFANELKIPGSDHFSIAKPGNKNALQHRTLREFLDRFVGEDIEPTAPQPPQPAPQAHQPSRKDIGALIADFLGSDPIRGAEALDGLVERGDEAQDALFARGFEEPATFQVRRRWLCYVRLRHATIVPKLIERLLEHKYGDSYQCALLLAGMPPKSAYRGKRSTLLSAFREDSPGRGSEFESSYYRGRYDDLLVAYGYGGGDAFDLWDVASRDHLHWEKTRLAGFRGACASFAMGHTGAAISIERFVCTVYDDEKRYAASHGLETIGSRREGFDANNAIQDEALWSEALFGAFSWWNKGVVADGILSQWSRHKHWRVRLFGAMALRHFRFQRLSIPLKDWIERESDDDIRSELSIVVADLEFDVLRESGQKSIGAATLKRLDSANDGETIVTLARFGHAHAQLDALRSSEDWYQRAIAALAFGYLRLDRKVLSTKRLLREASTPFESLLLATAVILLGRDDLPHSLHKFLVDGGSRAHDMVRGERVDVRYIHRFLQVAISDALKIGGTQAQRTAWEAEFGPLLSETDAE